MKKIMFITLILLLFVTCSGVWAADNITDEISIGSNQDDCAGCSHLKKMISTSPMRF